MNAFIKFSKKIAVFTLVLSIFTLGANTYAQMDEDDTTSEEETFVPPVASPTSQPVIIDDSDSSAATEVEYEE